MEFRAVPMERLAELLEFQLDRGGRAALTVTGNSMVPMLRHRRDSVVLTRPPEGGPRRGDIILYRRDSGQYVLHRVVEARGEDSLVCCGDHDWRREAVSPGQVLAVVAAFRRDRRLHTVEEPGYRLYSALWTALLPVRRPILAARRGLGRLRATLRENGTTARRNRV